MDGGQDSAQTALARPSRARRGLAGLLDAVALTTPVWLQVVRGRRAGAPGPRTSGPTWARRGQLLRVGFQALGEQLATPGELLAGVRQVDRRTGRRLALWRSLSGLALALGADALVRAVRGPTFEPPSASEAAERTAAVARIHAAHADDPDAMGAALSEHYRATAVHVDPLRAFVAPLAVSVVAQRLRRRLVATELVRAPRPSRD